MPRIALLLLVPALLVAAPGCARRPAPPARTVLHWVAARPCPAFDPAGPPEALRGALERLLSRGLFERNGAGDVRGAAAESAIVSADGRIVTLRLRRGLRFADGTPLAAADVRASLLAGLAREDHATRAWLLGAVEGMDKVRAGRPLPPLGIEAPDDSTVVFRLVRPDPLLCAKLASPAAGLVWKQGANAGWSGAVGIGERRVVLESPGRLVFARAPGSAGASPDTVDVRFAPGASRVRAALRGGGEDLVWPLPAVPGGFAPPAGWRCGSAPASPPRRLLLVLRADVPPTTQLAARHALAHALNREELAVAAGAHASRGAWLDGAPAFDAPSVDAAQVRGWLARGRLGASFHVVLGWDADGPAGDAARVLQGQWAEQGLYAELRPWRGAAAIASPLEATGPQAMLVEAQAPLPGAAAELATLVLPLRGPAVGAFRTGWRTRDFDPWLAAGRPAAPLDAAAAQSRLEADRIAIPVADLPWRWAARVGGPVMHFAPDRGLILDLH